MTAYAGVLKIVRFNWPWYVAALLGTVGVILVLFFIALPAPWVALIVVGVLVGNGWLLGSLAVSHYIYDRSAIPRGAWLDGFDGLSIRRAAIFHAGHDEASAIVTHCLPATEIQVFDFYDAERNGTESLKRARALATHRDTAIAPEKIPVTDGTLELALVVFAAHEIRADDQRAAFFREIRRALAPTGRAIVVEHLRDLWNFLAYGPGAFHFLSRRTWRQSFADAGLEISRERSCTPFVRVFELRKN